MSRLKTVQSSEESSSHFNPEVKSYIYQVILEFQPFTTPDTMITVVAKDPLELLVQSEPVSENHLRGWENPSELPDPKVLKKMHRIVISLKEEGTVISAEGLSKDVFAAIREAKEKLIQHLSHIQDQVMSSQDRHQQVNNAINGDFGGDVGSGSSLH